ncbi:MAG: hypothetical protein ABIN89_02765 [Chitinophagaceae bacterium]
MEKLLRSNNTLVMNHLPGILNMIQILNMMMYGFVNNQPILFVQAIGSIQKSVQLPSTAPIKKWLVKQRQVALRATYYILLTVTALLVVFSNYITNNALLVAGSLDLLALVIRLFILPVKRKLHLRNPGAYSNHLKKYLALTKSTPHTLFSPIRYFQQ